MLKHARVFGTASAFIAISVSAASAQNVLKPVLNQSTAKIVDSKGKLLGPMPNDRLLIVDNKDAFYVRVYPLGFLNSGSGSRPSNFVYESSNCTGIPYIDVSGNFPGFDSPFNSYVKGQGSSNNAFFADAQVFYAASPYKNITVRSVNSLGDITCVTNPDFNTIAGQAKYVKISGYTPPFYFRAQ